MSLGDGEKISILFKANPDIFANPFDPTIVREPSKSSGLAEVVTSKDPIPPDLSLNSPNAVSSTSIFAPSVLAIQLTSTIPPDKYLHNVFLGLIMLHHHESKYHAK